MEDNNTEQLNQLIEQLERIADHLEYMTGMEDSLKSIDKKLSDIYIVLEKQIPDDEY